MLEMCKKNTVNYRKNASCACLRGCVRVKKTRFSCMGAQFCIFGAMLHAAFGMCDVQKTL